MTTAIETFSKPAAPWVGIGEQGEWTDVKQAMAACGLDFEVAPKNLQFAYTEDDGSNYFGNVPGFKATVREDTHEALGCVSSTYTIVQNEEIFSMLDPFVKAGGVVTNGGMTAEGLCFMVLDMGVLNAGGDSYTMNVMATNSFNGRFPAALICSPVRIICQNMYRQLMGNTDNVARYRHTVTAGSKLNALKAATDAFINYKGVFGAEVEMLKQRKAKHSIDEVVEMMFPYTSLAQDSSRYGSMTERIDEQRTHYINRYYNSATNSDYGSCFALVNAYYDYTSHNVPVRSTEEQYKSKRLSTTVGGTMIKPKLMSFMCE